MRALADGSRPAAPTSWPLWLAAFVYLASLSAASLRVAVNPEWNLDGLFYSALMHAPPGSTREAGRPEASRPIAALLIGIWSASALRFLVVPILADRFLAPAYVVTLALAPALMRSRQ